MDMPINSFKGEHAFLSNFFTHPKLPAALGGFPTTEHFFQAFKTNNLDQRKLFLQEGLTAGQAKRLGKKVDLRDDWEEIKFEVMTEALTLKFSIPELRRLLVNTGTAILVEGNVWHDNFWGNCVCSECNNKIGLNQLGLRLMSLRTTLQLQQELE